jgi:hypothetical protein
MSLNVKALKDAFAKDYGHTDFESMVEAVDDRLDDMFDYTTALLLFVEERGDEFQRI